MPDMMSSFVSRVISLAHVRINQEEVVITQTAVDARHGQVSLKKNIWIFLSFAHNTHPLDVKTLK